MMDRRVLGIVLLVVGVGLLITGLSAKDSFADRWSDFWTGHFTDATMWYIVGGAALAVVGFAMTVSRRRTT